MENSPCIASRHIVSSTKGYRVELIWFDSRQVRDDTEYPNSSGSNLSSDFIVIIILTYSQPHGNPLKHRPLIHRDGTQV